jgi:hypothetical protein
VPAARDREETGALTATHETHITMMTCTSAGPRGRGRSLGMAGTTTPRGHRLRGPGGSPPQLRPVPARKVPATARKPGQTRNRGRSRTVRPPHARHLQRRDWPTTPISRTHGLHPGFTTSCCRGSGTDGGMWCRAIPIEGAGRCCELDCDLLGIQAPIIQGKDRKDTGHGAGKCHRCGRH